MSKVRKQLVVRVEKAIEVLEADEIAAFEANQVLPPDCKIEPPKSGILKAFDDRNTVVLMLNENVPEEMQADWLRQPVTRAHRRRMKKAINKIYGEQFTC